MTETNFHFGHLNFGFEFYLDFENWCLIFIHLVLLFLLFADIETHSQGILKSMLICEYFWLNKYCFIQ